METRGVSEQLGLPHNVKTSGRLSMPILLLTVFMLKLLFFVLFCNTC